jgi:hypothetical protein
MLGVPVFFLEAGTNIHKRLRTLRCWRWTDFGLTNPLLAISSKDLSEFTYTNQDLNWVTRHFLSLLEARSHVVFSRKREGSFDFLSRFPNARGRKVIVATMSSFDEVYSAFLAGLWPEDRAKSKVYRTQVLWIQELIDYAGRNPDLFLVVRVHPRDFPNKREGLVSDQGRELLGLFDRLPENVSINWPDEAISIYNLIFYADVVTTGWSITALEAGILGIPVVTYDRKLPSYPETLMFTGGSTAEYFENMRKAIDKGWTFEQSVNSYDWWSLSHNYGALLVSESFRSFEDGDVGFFNRLFNRLAAFANYPYMLKKFATKKHMNAGQLRHLRFLIERDQRHVIEVEEVKSELKRKKETSISDYKRELGRILHAVWDGSEPKAPVVEKIRNFLNG